MRSGARGGASSRRTRARSTRALGAALLAALLGCDDGVSRLDPAATPHGDLDLGRALAAATQPSGEEAYRAALERHRVAIRGWDFRSASDDPRFLPQGALEDLRHRDGALRARVGAGGGGVSRYVRALDTAEITHVRIVASAERGGVAHFRWRRLGEPEFGAADAVTFELEQGTTPVAHEVQLSEKIAPLPMMQAASGWTGTIDAIRIDFPADAGEVALHSVELLHGPSRDAQILERVRHGRTRHVELRGGVRAVLPPGEARYRVDLRESCQLFASIGVLPAAVADADADATFRFEVRFEPEGLLAGAPRVLFSRTLRPGSEPKDRGWQAVKLDLVDRGRAYGTLVLDAQAEGAEGDAPTAAPPAWHGTLWADPHVLLSRRISSPEPDVLLISLDTLRADALGAYGNPRSLSPGIDRLLARRGVTLANVRAPASWTLPSHVSLFTGLSPLTHGVVSGEGRLAPEFQTLAEALGDEGYRTLAVVGSSNLAPEWGFVQGFDFYNMVWELERGVSSTIERVAELRRRQATPLFCFFHTTQIHAEYTPPDPYRTLFAPPPATTRYDGSTSGQILELNKPYVPVTPEEVQHLHDLYEAEVAVTDHHVARLLRSIAPAGRDCLVVLVSDHGEGFREHGSFEHGTSLYDELLHVPVLLRMDGELPAGRVAASTASLTDVLPTVLGLTGADAARRVDGTDLAAAIRSGGRALPRAVDSLLESSYRAEQHYALTDGDRKVVWRPDSGALESFDLAGDPTELVPGAAPPELEQELRRRVAARSLPAGSDDLPLSEEAIDQLEALGYLGR